MMGWISQPMLHDGTMLLFGFLGGLAVSGAI